MNIHSNDDTTSYFSLKRLKTESPLLIEIKTIIYLGIARELTK